jgi:hypothetical protein
VGTGYDVYCAVTFHSFHENGIHDIDIISMLQDLQIPKSRLPLPLSEIKINFPLLLAGAILSNQLYMDSSDILDFAEPPAFLLVVFAIWPAYLAFVSLGIYLKALLKKETIPDYFDSLVVLSFIALAVPFFVTSVLHTIAVIEFSTIKLSMNGWFWLTVFVSLPCFPPFAATATSENKKHASWPVIYAFYILAFFLFLNVTHGTLTTIEKSEGKTATEIVELLRAFAFNPSKAADNLSFASMDSIKTSYSRIALPQSFTTMADLAKLREYLLSKNYDFEPPFLEVIDSLTPPPGKEVAVEYAKICRSLILNLLEKHEAIEGKIPSAKDYAIRLENLYRQLFTDTDNEFITLILRLAVFYNAIKDYPKASELYLEAIPLALKHSHGLEIDHNLGRAFESLRLSSGNQAAADFVLGLKAEGSAQ